VTRIAPWIVSCLLALTLMGIAQPNVSGQATPESSEAGQGSSSDYVLRRTQYRKAVRKWRDVARLHAQKHAVKPIPQPNPIHPGLVAVFQLFASLGGLLAFNTMSEQKSEGQQDDETVV